MSQIINLSLSQSSNHLISHFENYHNGVLLQKGFSPETLRHQSMKKQSPSSNLVNYYPRSVLIDYSNGTGALDKHSFFDLEFLTPDIPQLPTSTPLNTQSDYQTALNKGAEASNLILDRHDFWSDFSNVIHKPSTILTLKSHVYNPENGLGQHKDFPDQLFKDPKLGSQEFKTLRDDIEDEVRLQFEDADTVDKVNIVVELDSAWSGFAEGVLNDLIDFQLNGHSNRIVYWGLMKETLSSPVEKLNRVKSLLNVEQLMGCFMGLQLNNDIWESTAMMSLPFYEFNEYKLDDMQTLTKNNEYKYINRVQLSDMVLSPNFFDQQPPRRRVNKLSSIEYTSSVDVQSPTLPDSVREYEGGKILFQADDSLRSQWASMAKFIKSAMRGGDSDERGEYIEQLGSLRETYSFGYESYSSDDDDY